MNNQSIESYRHRNRAVVFLLSAAVTEIYRGKRTLILDHSFVDGYYCVLKEQKQFAEGELERLDATMRDLARSFGRLKTRHALPEHWHHLRTPRMRVQRPPLLVLGDHYAPSFEFTNLDLKHLPEFELMPYDRGFILRTTDSDSGLKPFSDSPKLFQMMKEYERWGRILQVASIADLNQQIMTMGFKKLIWIAEGLHEKRLSRIADEIAAQKGFRIIFVAGPSSSGKTTFSRRLSIHLAVNGLRSRYLSMVDYFRDRIEIPAQADGTLDFESVHCVDLKALQHDMDILSNGGYIRKRRYDFIHGIPQVFDETMHLEEDEVLILEGIHGLNPLVHAGLQRDQYYRVYISALTQLNIDNTHPVATSDGRLIRRIVRDHRDRGYSANDTIQRWNSVREGEVSNIFPFQEEADIMFNSALIYELAILKRYALPLLKKASPNTVRDRLITLLSLFHAIPDRHVPGTSILREFIGKSYFQY